MALYFVRRLLVLVLLLFVFSFLIFSLVYLAPGSPEQALLGPNSTSPERIAALREEYGLDDPFLVQYGNWLIKAVQFDFGRSFTSSQPVSTAIADRVGLTLLLGLIAFVLTMVVGITLGIIAAVKRQKAADRTIIAGSIVGVSSPSFATGILLIYVFAVLLGLFPALGGGDDLPDMLWHLTLPAITLALAGTALVVRYTRVAMIDALKQDYVQFARAGGLPMRRILLAYGLRNALIPVITSANVILAFVLANAVIVEVTFNLPGIGALLIDAVSNKDVPLVQGVMLCIAATIFTINLLTDIAYAAIDPRVRLGAVT